MRSWVGRAAFAFVLGAMLVFIPQIRAAADTWVGGFVRDANSYLDVNCKIGCAAIAPNQNVQTANITSATTTTVVSGIGGESIYLFFAGWESSAAGTTEIVNFEWGTGSNCGTNTVKMLPGATGISPGTAGDLYPIFAPVSFNNTYYTLSPTPVPLILPAGDSLCMVISGTAIAAYGMAMYAQQ